MQGAKAFSPAWFQLDSGTPGTFSTGNTCNLLKVAKETALKESTPRQSRLLLPSLPYNFPFRIFITLQNPFPFNLSSSLSLTSGPSFPVSFLPFYSQKHRSPSISILTSIFFSLSFAIEGIAIHLFLPTTCAAVRWPRTSLSRVPSTSSSSVDAYLANLLLSPAPARHLRRARRSQNSTAPTSNTTRTRRASTLRDQSKPKPTRRSTVHDGCELEPRPGAARPGPRRLSLHRLARGAPANYPRGCHCRYSRGRREAVASCSRQPRVAEARRGDHIRQARRGSRHKHRIPLSSHASPYIRTRGDWNTPCQPAFNRVGL